MFNSFSRIVSGFFLFTLAFNSAGQAHVKGATPACAGLENDTDRLQCYDRTTEIYNRDVLLVPSQWKSISTIDPMNDTVRTSIHIVSQHDPYDPRNGFNESVHDRLFIRCTNTVLDIWIAWGGSWNGHTLEIKDPTVKYRVGYEKARSSKWLKANQFAVTFYPDDAMTFLESLIESDRFVAQIPYYNEQTLTAVFNLDGITNAVTLLNPKCVDDGLGDYSPELRKLIRDAAKIR